MTENQTRPELNKQAHHLLHEAIGHDEKCKDCDYYRTSDFHAKPFPIHDADCEKGMDAILYCEDAGCQMVYSEKDVLAEREHYQKRISFLESSVKRLITRAKAAERKLALLTDKPELVHLDRAINGSYSWKNRAEKAEARVAELEIELKRERNWSKYETKQVKERDKTIKALAGEKTK